VSAKATFWAWEQLGLKSPSKLVLLCLANNHNEDSNRCDPGPAYISNKTGLNVKTIRTAIKNLGEIGVLTAHQRVGKTPNYVLNFGAGDLFSPYPKKGTPEKGQTQKRVYPKEDSTLPEKGSDPTQIRVPNLKETKKNINNIYQGIDFSSLSEKIETSLAEQYIDYRIKLNFPIVQAVFDDIMETASQESPEQFCPNKILVFVMGKGWGGLSLKWIRDAILKDSSLLLKLTLNAAHAPEQESTQPEWTKYFNNIEDKMNYDSQLLILREYQRIENPTNTDLGMMESIKKTLNNLKIKKPEGANA